MRHNLSGWGPQIRLQLRNRAGRIARSARCTTRVSSRPTHRCTRHSQFHGGRWSDASGLIQVAGPGSRLQSFVPNVDHAHLLQEEVA